jgi:hypothetical protein
VSRPRMATSVCHSTVQHQLSLVGRGPLSLPTACYPFCVYRIVDYRPPTPPTPSFNVFREAGFSLHVSMVDVLRVVELATVTPTNGWSKTSAL